MTRVGNTNLQNSRIRGYLGIANVSNMNVNGSLVGESDLEIEQHHGEKLLILDNTQQDKQRKELDLLIGILVVLS